MTPERWLKAKELFCQALECEPSRRNAFLEHACADDQELLLEVESLLSAVEDSQLLFNQPAVDLLGLNGLKLGEFLEEDELAPASGPAGPDLPLPEIPKPKSALIGQQIGNYRLTKLIGRGGMGAVFLAVRADGDYDHEVAVKIVARPALTREVLRRFRTERQILARLDHPHIAKLFDGGTTPDGLPYFVMEYIEGEPITSYCDNRQLSIPERLRLFLKVCEAVQYAHQNLVIHRDIKPSNILVTAEGIPKLLDFGIAKVIAPRTAAVKTIETTKFGVLAFTPRYASPEQVRGQTVTTVSDVYSLGVLLYELLTGVPPYEFPQMLPAEIERVVCLIEPLRPGEVVRDRKKAKVEASVEVEAGQSLASAKTALERSTARGTTPEKLRLQLVGDLDTIVLMALRKEPERRYPLVAKLAEDLERHLTGLPVLARGDTVRYRFGKYVRRHKLAVAATVLVVVSLVGGTGVSLWQARRANQERIKAEQAQAKSDRRFNDVRHLAKKILFEIHDKIENLPGSTEARKMIVEESLKYLDSLSKEVTNDPELQMELAINYRKVGDVQGRPNSASLGDIEGALKSYQQSVNMLDQLCFAYPKEIKYLYNLSASYERLGKFYDGKLGNRETALYYYQQNVQILTKIIELNSDNKEYQIELAAFSTFFGFYLERRGRLREAISHWQFALKRDLELQSKDSGSLQLSRRVAITYQRIGFGFESAGDLVNRIGSQNLVEAYYHEALKAYQESLRVLLFQQSTGETNTLLTNDILSLKQSLGLLLVKLGRFDEAIQIHQQAVGMCEKLSLEDPQNTEFKVSLVWGYVWLGECYQANSNKLKAKENFHKGLKVYDQIKDLKHNDAYLDYRLAQIYFDLGRLYVSEKKIELSLRHLLSAALVLEKLVSRNPENMHFNQLMIQTYCLMASIYHKKETETIACQYLQKFINMKTSRLKNSTISAGELEEIAWLLLTSELKPFRNPQLAIEYAEQAVVMTQGQSLLGLLTLALGYHLTNQGVSSNALKSFVSFLPVPQSFPAQLIHRSIEKNLLLRSEEINRLVQVPIKKG